MNPKSNLFQTSLALSIALILALTMANGLLAQTAKTNAAGSSDSLTKENFNSWKNHILPTDSELAWTRIDWQPDLKTGIEKAAAAGKPVLLWTMNGHPMGCT